MRISTPIIYRLVVLVTSIYAIPTSSPKPQGVVPLPSCKHDVPLTGYPMGFSTWTAGIRNLQALCVSLDPGPRCTCVEIANGSWQVVCRPTGPFAVIPEWPNVNTNCVWGCNCYATPDSFIPTDYGVALGRMQGLTGKSQAISSS